MLFVDCGEVAIGHGEGMVVVVRVDTARQDAAREEAVVALGGPACHGNWRGGHLAKNKAYNR